MERKAVIISRKLHPLFKSPIEVKINGVRYEVGCYYDIYEFGNDWETTLPANDFNYFCYNKQNKITCWPTKNGVQPVNDRGQWKLEGRQEIKPGKFLMLFEPFIVVYDCDHGRRVYTSEERTKVLTRACEIFTDRIRGMNSELIYEITNKISQVYNTRPDETSGYLNNSCMRPDSGHGCRWYADFYNLIPNAKILYHKSPVGELMFRALLWENAQTRSGLTFTFLDRIYSSEPFQEKIISVAKENGWGWRYFGDDRVRHEDQVGLCIHTNIPRKAGEYLHREGSPYMDTLNRLSRDGKDLRLSNYISSYIAHITDSSGGTHSVIESCYLCGKEISPNLSWETRERRTVHERMLCATCYRTRTAKCGGCDDRCLTDHMVNYKGKWYCPSCKRGMRLTSCDHCYTWHRREDMYYDEYSGNYYCMHCYEHWFYECTCCHKRHHPQRFPSVRLDGHMTRRICRDCIRLVYKCPLCNSYHSGTLPGMPYICPLCRTRIAEYYNVASNKPTQPVVEERPTEYVEQTLYIPFEELEELNYEIISS